MFWLVPPVPPIPPRKDAQGFPEEPECRPPTTSETAVLLVATLALVAIAAYIVAALNLPGAFP
jgi:hypothetical protein